jgi:hypothetical protein
MVICPIAIKAIVGLVGPVVTIKGNASPRTPVFKFDRARHIEMITSRIIIC